MSTIQEMLNKNRGRPPTPEGCAYGVHCEVPDSLDYLVCYGASHKAPKRVHLVCAEESEDVDRNNWYCDHCREASEGQPDSQGTMGTERGWGVAGILKSDVREGKDVVYVEWCPQAGQRFNPSWIEIADVDDMDLLQRFRAEGKAVWIPDFQPSDDEAQNELLTAAIAKASDLKEVAEVAYNPYKKHIRYGFVALLEAIWPKVQEKHRSIGNMTWPVFKDCGLEVLASTPAEAFLAICSGSFSAIERKSARLEAIVEKYRISPSSNRRPCIYVIELADEVEGGGLRLWQMARIVKHARDYLLAREDNFAIRIHNKLRGDAEPTEEDLLLNERIKAGTRPFFNSANMAKSMRKLCDTIEEDLTQFRSQGYDENDKMPYALRHIGYAIDGYTRLRNHDNHRSTNPLLSMFACIAKADPKLSGCVAHAHIFFQCWRQLHGSLGEIIYSVIGQSYIETGRGFNSSAAGITTSSVGKQDIEQKWALWLNNVLVRSNFLANLDAEQQRIADTKAELKRAKKELQQWKQREIAEKTRMADLYLSLKHAVTRLNDLKLQLAQVTEQEGTEEEFEDGTSAPTRPSVPSPTQAPTATPSASALQPAALAPTNAPQLPVYPNWHSSSPDDLNNFMRGIRNDRAALEGAIRSMFAANQAHYSAALNNHIANAVYRGHTQRFWARQGPGFPYIAFLSPEDDKERSPWY